MATTTDRLNDYYTFLLIGVVALIFFAGFMSGKGFNKNKEE
jgi:hypothetical protein